MKKGIYKSWKGDNIQIARDEALQLESRIGRHACKRDYIKNGLYNVWMALYRNDKSEKKQIMKHGSNQLFIRNVELGIESLLSQEIITVKRFITATKDTNKLIDISMTCLESLAAIDYHKAQSIANKFLKRHK